MLGNIPYLINSGAILREEGIDNLKITNHETKYICPYKVPSV